MKSIDKILNSKKKQPLPMSQVYSHVFVDKDIHQELKEYCADNGLTLKDVVSALIEDFLNEQDHKGAKN